MAEAFKSFDLDAIRRRAVRVDHLDDPRVADFRNLRDRTLWRERGAFVAESEVVLRVLVARGRYRIRAVFLADTKLDKVAPDLAPLAPEVPIFTASSEVLDRVVGFPIHRGVLASADRRPVVDAATMLAALPPGPARVVALEGLTNHDNVGGVFRNAAAFGAAAVALDHATCDPLYRKAIRVSVGGSLVVPWSEDASMGSILDALTAHGFDIWALTPSPDAEPLHTLTSIPERVAVVLGTEGPGLTEASMARARRRIRVDIEPDFDSLNVAATSGIVLHHLRGHGAAAPEPRRG